MANGISDNYIQPAIDWLSKVGAEFAFGLNRSLYRFSISQGIVTYYDYPMLESNIPFNLYICTVGLEQKYFWLTHS